MTAVVLRLLVGSTTSSVIRVANRVGQHAFGDDAAHFARLHVDDEERLASCDFARIGALLLQARDDGPLVVAEADAERDELVGPGDFVYSQNRADAEVGISGRSGTSRASGRRSRARPGSCLE